jgi:nucleotide-binding universal stress UspA family protein
MAAMTSPPVVVWLAEGTWQPTVEAAAAIAPPAADIVLLHVIDIRVTEALHGAYGGLLGRGQRSRDPADTLDQLAAAAGRELLAGASTRLGRPARHDMRTGRAEREVITACQGAALLVCARDGDRTRLGPKSLGRHTRFVLDHAPCAVLLIWPDQPPELGSIPPPPRHPPHPHR